MKVSLNMNKLYQKQSAASKLAWASRKRYNLETTPIIYAININGLVYRWKTFIFFPKIHFQTYMDICVYNLRQSNYHPSIWEWGGEWEDHTWHWLSGWGRGSTSVQKKYSDVTFVSRNLFSSDFGILSWMRKFVGFLYFYWLQKV